MTAASFSLHLDMSPLATMAKECGALFDRLEVGSAAHDRFAGEISHALKYVAKEITFLTTERTNAAGQRLIEVGIEPGGKFAAVVAALRAEVGQGVFRDRLAEIEAMSTAAFAAARADVAARLAEPEDQAFKARMKARNT